MLPMGRGWQVGQLGLVRPMGEPGALAGLVQPMGRRGECCWLVGGRAAVSGFRKQGGAAVEPGMQYSLCGGVGGHWAANCVSCNRGSNVCACCDWRVSDEHWGVSDDGGRGQEWCVEQWRWQRCWREQGRVQQWGSRGQQMARRGA